MPNYFSDYDTTVHFISEEELKRDHSGIPHGGFVIRSGRIGWDGGNSHVIEYSLKLDSNPSSLHPSCSHMRARHTDLRQRDSADARPYLILRRLT